MSYGFKFYNSSGEIVLDDSYIKPWFAGKGTPTSVTGPVSGYNNDKYYTVNYSVPNIGGLVNFTAITLPNNTGEYWADTNWSVGYTFSISAYFNNSYIPVSADAPEVYFFSVNPVNPRSTSGYGIQLRNAVQECTFDSNVRHFKPSNAVAFTMPYRYATGYFSTSTGCGNPANEANCSQIITLSGVPTKAAFVLPYFFKSQAYTRYTANGNFSYLFDFQAVYKRSNTNEVIVRVATKNYEDMEGFYANYDLTQGGDNQYIIYIDGSRYDIGGGTINFPAATYSLSANPTSVAEGNNVVVTLTTTGVANNTSIPWVINGTNITSEDFSLGGILTGNFIVQNNTASVAIATTRNDNTEGTETATFSLGNGAASIAFNIINVPYYTTPNITSFSYSPASPDETNNSIVTFTINVQDNTVSGAPRNFYWAIEGGANVTGDDFVGLIYGTLTTENGTGTRTFSITIKQDYVTENSTEQFRVNFYTAGPYQGTSFYSSSYITIADTSKDRPTINYFQIKPNTTGTYGVNVTGLSGETPYFRWSISNATSISINNGVGTVSATGEDVALVGAVLSANTYTLTATNQYGSITSSVTFNVSASTYSLSTSATSINENGSITITLTTTNVLDGTQVPYTINSNSFSSSDWSGGEITSSGIFIVNNNTASKTFTSLADTRTDGDKVLSISLVDYPALTVSSTILDTSQCPANGTVKTTTCIGYTKRVTVYNGGYSDGICTTTDTDYPNSVDCGYVNYTITPNNTNITEGNTITYTVTTTNIANGTILYWTNSGTTGSSQGTVTINSNSGTFTIATTATNTYDGTRTVIANLRSVSYTGSIVATANTVSVIDQPTTWSLTQTATNITEGSSIGYTITTTNLVLPASIIYWEQLGTATATDMGSINGTINADGNGTYSLTINTTVDAIYNNPLKTVQLRFRNLNSSGAVLATSQVTTLNNAAPTYSVNCYPASLNETSSQLGTFTVTTTNIQNSTTLYWKNTGTTNSSDFTDGLMNGTVVISNNTGSFTRTISRDQTDEGTGTETIVMEIHSGSSMNAGTLVANTTVEIADTSEFTDWEIVGPSSLNEGISSTYYVTGTQYVSTWGSTRVYLTINHSTTNSSDVSISNPAGLILSNDAGEAAFIVTTIADQSTESNETFILELRKDNLSNSVIASKQVTIIDTSRDPVYSNVQINSITWTPTSVNEGDSITFTVNATDNITSGAPRNFYYAAIGGFNTTAADFSGNGYGTLTSQNGTFTRYFTINIAADQITEPNPSPETFSVGIYKTGPYVGSPYYQTTNININDTSQTPNPPTINYFQIKLSGGSYGGSVGPVSSAGATPFFRWSTSNANTVNITGYGNTSASGNDVAIAGNVTTTTTWILTASNAGGSVTISVTMYVCAADGVWDGSSWSCYGTTNRYKTVSNGSCGTRQGDLLESNAYQSCCSQDTTTVLENICIVNWSSPQRRRMYNNGQCGYNYIYTADSSCCPGIDEVFLGWTTCSGCIQYAIYSNGASGSTNCASYIKYSQSQSCNSTPGGYTGATACYESNGAGSGILYQQYQYDNCAGSAYLRSSPPQICCLPYGTYLSQYCSGSTLITVYANGSCSTTTTSTPNAYASCCPGAGWSGNTQCIHVGGTTYGTISEFYNNGQCGGYWENRGTYCCLPYGTYLYGYCASSNPGNNNWINVYSGGGSPTECNAYTTTDYNASQCYVTPPLTISCSASPSSLVAGGGVGTTLSWSTSKGDSSCVGNVQICALDFCTGYVYTGCSSQPDVGGNITTTGTIPVYFTVNYNGETATCTTNVTFYRPSDGGGGGGGGGTQEN